MKYAKGMDAVGQRTWVQLFIETQLKSFPSDLPSAHSAMSCTCHILELFYIKKWNPYSVLAYLVLVFCLIFSPSSFSFHILQRKKMALKKDYWESILAEGPITFQQRHLMRETKNYRNIEKYKLNKTQMTKK